MAKRKQTQRGREITPGTSLTLGVLAAVVISVILAGVLALLIVNGSIPESGAAYGVMIIHFLASLIGTVVAGRGAAQKAILRGGALGGIYLAVLLGSAFLFFDGISNPVGAIAAIIVGCLVPPLLQMTRKTSAVGRRKRYSC